MPPYLTNEERTARYLASFNREKVLKLLIKSHSPTIFDVGANLGSTLTEFKDWWPDASVHCFEPQEECFEQLAQKAAAYSEGQCVINRVGVGSSARDAVPFYTHDTSLGMSGFHKVNLRSRDSVTLDSLGELGGGAEQSYRKTLNHERQIQVIRLDNYMEERGVERVHLLKIDTQGSEPEVLEGLGERVSDVDVVILELMFYDFYERSVSFSDVERFLHPGGLLLYDISHISKNPMNGRTDWVDAVYVNRRVITGE